MNFQYIKEININKAFIIHFKFKSTQELVNKFKRGYKIISKNRLNRYILLNIIDYFKINNVTMEKINFISNKLSISLIIYFMKINHCMKGLQK
jgi:hypothetical protein